MLVRTGVIDSADAVCLIEIRGKLIQEAVLGGTSVVAATIGLDDASAAKVCEEAAEGQVVSPANFNPPGQMVIAGHKETIECAGTAYKATGAKRVLPLSMNVPSHCVLVKPATDELTVELAKITFNTPTVPAVNNVDVRCEASGDATRDALVRQLYNPVQWTKSVEYMVAQSVGYLYEVDPDKVLTGLTKRIIDTPTALTLDESSMMAAALELQKRKIMNLKGKVALVTGVSRGIGRIAAETFAVRGAKVTGTATSENGTQAVSDYLGVNGKGLMLNVTNPAFIESVLEEIHTGFGGVDILVSNAGIIRDNLLVRMGDEEWNDIIETGLSFTFRLSKAVICAMMKKCYGRIITIGSVAGATGSGGQANHAAARASLIGFSKSLAHEVTSCGIIINVVTPGFTEIDMTCVPNNDQRVGILVQIPADHLDGARRIVNVVASLISDEAAYITGETLHVDGGMHVA